MTAILPRPGPPGPPGATGATGPPGTGGGDAHYEHSQLVPSAVWVINHGLGKRPSVDVVDSAGSGPWEGAIDYTTLNQVVITFSAPFGGTAILN